MAQFFGWELASKPVRVQAASKETSVDDTDEGAAAAPAPAAAAAVDDGLKETLQAVRDELARTRRLGEPPSAASEPVDSAKLLARMRRLRTDMEGSVERMRGHRVLL